jgi:hypothetical protein
MDRPGRIRTWKNYARWRHVHRRLSAQGLSAGDTAIAMREMWEQLDSMFAYRSQRGAGYAGVALEQAIADAAEEQQQKEKACTSTTEG